MAGPWPLLSQAALALHAHPEMRLGELPGLLADAFNRRRPQGDASIDVGSESAVSRFLLGLLSAACEGELQEVVLRCSQWCSKWFMAHVFDLFEGPGPHQQPGRGLIARPLGLLPGSASPEQCSEAEKFVVSWVLALMPNPGTWRVAAAYLAWCPMYGEGLMQAMLRRTAPSEDSKQALRILDVCATYGLTGIAREVCTSLGQGHAAAGRGQLALQWFLRGEDELNASLLAARTLRAAAEGADPSRGPLGSAEDLAALLPSATRGGRAEAMLQLAAEHASLQKELASGRGGEAARTALLRLLRARQLPGTLRWSLLRSAADLVSSGRLQLSYQDASEVLGAFVAAELDRAYEAARAPEDRREAERIRALLTQSVAAAHVREASSAKA